jgi:hypothetical protein
MNTMVQILKKAAVAGDLGIEIELEGRGLPDDIGGYWKAVGDASLRNGIEYVLRKPLVINKVPEAMDQLNKNLIEYGSKIEYSFRTSVHVHVNVQQYTYPQLLNLIYTYLLIEAPLMDFCGEVRKNNRFCLRLQDAEYFVDVIRDLFEQGPKAIKNIPNNKIRYASINLEALKKFGSVEFRGLRGTCDKDTIVNWCTALSDLGEFAKKCKDPMKVYEIFSSQTPESFFRQVICTNADKFLIRDFTDEFQQSFSLSLDLPFSYKEIEEKDEPQEVVDIDEDLRERIIKMAGELRPVGAGPAIIPKAKVRKAVVPDMVVFDDILDMQPIQHEE